MSESQNELASVENAIADRLSKVNLTSDNLEEHSVKENENLSNCLSPNSKPESIDDNHEFVEANSSFPNDVIEHNDDDKLTFKGFFSNKIKNFN